MNQEPKTFAMKHKDAFKDLYLTLAGLVSLAIVILYFMGIMAYNDAVNICKNLKEPTDQNIEFVLSSHGFPHKDAYDPAEPTTAEYILSSFNKK